MEDKTRRDKKKEDKERDKTKSFFDDKEGDKHEKQRRMKENKGIWKKAEKKIRGVTRIFKTE